MSQKLEDFIPVVKYEGINTDKDASFGGSTSFTGAVAFTGSVSGVRGTAEVVASGDKTVTAAMSGRTFIATASSGTQTFTLPDAGTTQGLTYSFVCGHASGEILITPASGDSIVGKTHGAENGTGIAPAAGTGIKNTAATNVVGDFCTLVFDGVSAWYMTSVAGVWASQ
jgi:hypothetical protein